MIKALERFIDDVMGGKKTADKKDKAESKKEPKKVKGSITIISLDKKKDKE